MGQRKWRRGLWPQNISLGSGRVGGGYGPINNLTFSIEGITKMLGCPTNPHPEYTPLQKKIRKHYYSRTSIIRDTYGKE